MSDFYESEHGAQEPAGIAAMAMQHSPQDTAVHGDVTLAGLLPAEPIVELAKQHKAWICLLDVDHPQAAAMHDAAVAADAELQWLTVPFSFPPKEGQADAVLAALDSAQRPLVLSCVSATRASVLLLLWLAKARGYTAASARQLAEDMDLKFYTRCEKCGPMREWAFAQLPGGSGEPMAEVGVAKSSSAVFVQQLFDPVSCTMTYLIACRKSGQALLLDPVLEQKDRDLKLLDELGFELKCVVNTHVHADHITSGGVIRKERPNVQTFISLASAAAGDVKVKTGDAICVGELKLEVRATPGHTAGCLSYVLWPSPGETGPAMAFTGDALLIRGCGRTDFQGGSAENLYDNVHAQIFSLPDETVIYPGHDYKGRNMSTVGEEKAYNFRLTKDKEAFVKLMAELGLPYPKKIDAAVPANMVCGFQD